MPLSNFLCTVKELFQKRREVQQAPFTYSVPVPIKNGASAFENGVVQLMQWQGNTYTVYIENAPLEAYNRVMWYVSKVFNHLNKDNTLRNRDVIMNALEYALLQLPDVNPSDVYQHIVYRLYIREYTKSKADQSWVRAGGDAVEQFILKHYTTKLAPYGITIKPVTSKNRESVLKLMRLKGKVGDSKLDMALYGMNKGDEVLFGGIHCKASLAERVSDDVPCSEAMMQAGFYSYLLTFDSKSHPPPKGDLVNRGELGTCEKPSDKRLYIEKHGSFDACFSFNTRTVASHALTDSGKSVYVSSLNVADPFVYVVRSDWNEFKSNL